MNELIVDAKTENLNTVLDFVNCQLDQYESSMKIRMQLDVAVEELFVNIAHYAYDNEMGKATIQVEVNKEPLSVIITFIDQGKPYDPLAKPDPDITLPAEERPIGGLGIFMVKKSMDNVKYEYKDGSNILTIEKNL